ncbi:ABC transporter substrate-binding protein [Paenibacillus sp. NPDC056579]|uniref:ABC transporter substrate-binding protein n=1 Tax=Paenibacillus sp. NPDC056579 TaxID=3345871 RepID=UPI003690C072
MKFQKLIPLVALSMLFTACSGGSQGAADTKTAESGDAVPQNKEPVELVFASDAGKTPDDFEKEIAEPLRKKFPWLTVKYIERGQGTNIGDLVTAGTPPDIYWYVYNRFPNLVQGLGLDYDMTELIKKYKFDTNRLEAASMKALDQYTGGKGIYGLPFISSTTVMYYNKDIFDKFGMAYPKDGMTWDEVYELAKKMTRELDGVKYRGLSTFHGYLLRENPYGLRPLDPATGKASLNTDEWKKLYQNLARIYAIPGNNRPNSRATNPELQAFAKEQTIAMAVINNDLNHVKLIPEGMNWDVVSMPTFPDKPNVADQPSPWMYSIMKTSQHKEAAFEVLAYMLSDEFLMMESKRGVRTPSTNDQIKKAFGSDSPFMNGKNVGAYYYHKSADTPSSGGDPKLMALIPGGADAVVNNKLLDVILEGKDINTALREGDEEINKLIENSKKQ